MSWLAVVCLITAGNQDATSASEVEAAKKERLAAMTAVVDAVTLTGAGDAPATFVRSEHPLIRFTNPVTSAFGEGCLYLWLEGQRPVAAVCLSCREPGAIYWELSSLSDKPLRLNRNGQPIWTPQSASRSSAELPKAPAPAASPAARLTQLRAQARRFQVREERRDAWHDARLLTQPLYQWAAPEQGVIHGALFSFAETTDPEVLLFFEARQNASGAAAWWFAVAKMTSSPCILTLDEQEIWSGTGFWRNPRGPADPYQEANVGKIDPELLKLR